MKRESPDTTGWHKCLYMVLNLGRVRVAEQKACEKATLAELFLPGQYTVS